MSQRIYVSNLPVNIANEAVAEKFAKFGIVYSAKVITEKKLESTTGVAFVEMAFSEDAEKAISNLNESFFGGRLIRVSDDKKSLLH